MSRSRTSVIRYCWALLFGFAASLPSSAHAEGDGDAEQPDPQIRLRLELGGVGYQGNWTRQSFADPSGATLRVQRHGAELVGGFFNAVVERKRRITTYHSENGRAGFLFGGTNTPGASGVPTGTSVPRGGFNFGLFSDFRENGGVAIGGVCGGSFSGITGFSLKAFTRSTLPGNHLEADLGVAAGVHCGLDDTFILVQYSIEGDLGVEQVQDLSSQQGLDGYDQSEGNALLFYAGHGPRLLAVRDTDVLHGALSAEYVRSIGDGKWGGKRQGVRAMLSLAFGDKANFGIAPWYRFDRVEFGDASKVLDPYDRSGHTVGLSFVAARPRKK